MTLLACYLVFIGLCFLVLCLLTIRFQTARYVHDTKKKSQAIHRSIKHIRTFRKLIIPVFLSVTLIVFFSYTAAFRHGMDYDVPVTELYHNIQNTPIASYPDNLDNSIVVLYRFDCSDCHKINRELTEAAQIHKNIYFIPSNSDLGKDLVEQYQIVSVPTGLSFKQDSVVQKKLIQNDSFNREGFQRLLEHQLDP